MTIGEKIVKLRKAAGYSQEVFSEKLGISRQAVSKWENDTAQPSNENLSRIAKLFGVPLSALLDDEDVDINTDYSEKKEKKSKKYDRSFLNSVAVVMLAVVMLVQSVNISGLKREINGLRNQMNNSENYQSQINSLYNYVHSLPSVYTQQNKDFIDYSYEITDFNYEENTARLKFSVVPTDYTADTKVQIVIKSADESYSADAVMENNIFTAQITVPCSDNLTVYLYLTDGGNTRSFVLDYLDNPANNFVLGIFYNQLSGKITTYDGKARLDLWNDVTVRYAIHDDSEKSVYPVKAVMRFYADGNLVAEIPHRTIMEHNFTEDSLVGGGAAVFGDEVSFGFSIEEEIVNERLHKGANFDAELVIVDSKGREYVNQAAWVI